MPDPPPFLPSLLLWWKTTLALLLVKPCFSFLFSLKTLFLVPGSRFLGVSYWSIPDLCSFLWLICFSSIFESIVAPALSLWHSYIVWCPWKRTKQSAAQVFTKQTCGAALHDDRWCIEGPVFGVRNSAEEIFCLCGRVYILTESDTLQGLSDERAAPVYWLWSVITVRSTTSRTIMIQVILSEKERVSHFCCLT